MIVGQTSGERFDADCRVRMRSPSLFTQRNPFPRKFPEKGPKKTNKHKKINGCFSFQW